MPRIIQPMVTRCTDEEADAADRAWRWSLSPLEQLRQLELARQYAYGSDASLRRLSQVPQTSPQRQR